MSTEASLERTGYKSRLALWATKGLGKFDLNSQVKWRPPTPVAVWPASPVVAVWPASPEGCRLAVVAVWPAGPVVAGQP